MQTWGHLFPYDPLHKPTNLLFLFHPKRILVLNQTVLWWEWGLTICTVNNFSREFISKLANLILCFVEQFVLSGGGNNLENINIQWTPS